MPTLIFEVPEDSDFWPCPEGCGGATEDPYGGPCKACWSRIGSEPCLHGLPRAERCPYCRERGDG